MHSRMHLYYRYAHALHRCKCRCMHALYTRHVASSIFPSMKIICRSYSWKLALVYNKKGCPHKVHRLEISYLLWVSFNSYTYQHICIYIYRCIYNIYAHVLKYMHISLYVWRFVCIYEYISLSLYIYTYISPHIHTYMHMYVHTSIYIYTYICTNMYNMYTDSNLVWRGESFAASTTLHTMKCWPPPHWGPGSGCGSRWKANLNII